MTIQNPYALCSCDSGKKIKFCCGNIRKKDPTELSAFLSNLPVYKCIITRAWKETGIGQISLIKKMPNDRYVIGLYLIDIWCLGVKDAGLSLDNDTSQVKAFLDKTAFEDMISISYEDARSLIFGALDFATNIGFTPHTDWNRARLLIEPERPFTEKYIFGREGKPFYVKGPYDDEERNTKDIIAKVKRHGGDWVSPMF